MDDWDRYHLGMAKKASEKSKDPSTKSGCVIVRPNRTIVSTGFNGFPRKFSDDPALYADREIKLKRTIHSEMNAILTAGEFLDGCTLYQWPFMCCVQCTIHVIQAGIIRVVAPITPEEKLKNWGANIELAKSFFKEAKVKLDLFDYDPE